MSLLFALPLLASLHAGVVLASQVSAEDAPLPTVSVDWRRQRLELLVRPPPGEHIATEAPGRIALSTEAS